MAITLDGNTLDVQKIQEHLIVVLGESEEWRSGAYANTTKVYGTTREWKLDCKEYGVVWTGSVIEALQTILEAKSTVTFIISDSYHNISVSVKIKAIDNKIDTTKYNKTYSLHLVEVA